MAIETPSQTAGPYVHIGCTPSVVGMGDAYREIGESPIQDGALGTPVTLTIKLLDGDGAPVTDALIETWQADGAGLFAGQSGADPNVRGWARITGDETGTYVLETIKPGAAPGSAPHIALWIVARGINLGLQTRAYFEDEIDDQDPVLSAVDPSRKSTLIATKSGNASYQFDIKLQGVGETVFLDI